MKSFPVLLTFVSMAYAGFVAPKVNKGFTPIAKQWDGPSSIEEDDNSEHNTDFLPSVGNADLMPTAEQWHTSVEEDDNSEHYDHHYGFDVHPKTVHVHEDYDHQYHYEDLHEHQQPTIVNFHEHPKTVHIHEKPEVEAKTVHVHEHHHHHHHHVKTLPVSIIKKTVYIKHG